MNNHWFLEMADRIGARICRDAIWDGDRCNWVAAGHGEDGPEFRALNPALYEGTSGIALFLGRLARVTGERIFADTASAALRQALSQVESPVSRFHPGVETGLYTGLCGVAVVLSEFDEPFHSQGIELAQKALALPAPRECDLIAGRAGALIVALRFARAAGESGGGLRLDGAAGESGGGLRLDGAAGESGGGLRLDGAAGESGGGLRLDGAGSPAFLDAAIRHGEALLSVARRSEAGWSWAALTDNASPERPDLNGFGHGAAGIAWALLELWHVTGECKYRSAAEEGFRYEQSRFSVEECNWPDLRDSFYENPATRYSTMWCHGAAGIAFSRLRAAQLTGEPQYREQAEVALSTVERDIHNQGNCCICHGLFGSIDLLLYANTAERIALAHDAARNAIVQYAERRLPWPCGLPGGPETPGLMLGLAGVGHTLLRLTDPRGVPSPLMIEC
jgi:lantibiotic modifying enzyme